MIFQYNDTPLPVGNPANLNGSEASYELGLADGGYHGEQYPDEPEESITFESPEAAGAWLAAATAVLTPYIESGDRSRRIPDATGWEDSDA